MSKHPQWNEAGPVIGRLLREARETVPFFQKTLTGSYAPEAITTYADFCRLPVMTKSMIQADPEAFRSRRFLPEELLVEFTSGSTGIPFRSYKTTSDMNASAMALWRMRRQIAPGVMGTKGVAFYAFREEQGQLITDSVYRAPDMLYLSLFRMNDEIFEEYWRAMLEFQPRWVVGTPTAVSQFASYLLRSKRSELDRVQLMLAEIGGEVSFPGQFNVIREAFRCPISVHYGAREVWPIAYTCQAGNLHVIHDHVFVEILRADGSPCEVGEQGQVHVTALRYRGAPLIRYALGDLARLDPNPCPCGRQSPVLLLDGGRASEYIVRRDGTKVSPVILFYILREILGHQDRQLRQIQMLQLDYDRFQISVVTGESWNRQLEARLRARLCDFLGPAEIEFRQVAGIQPSDRTGKTQFFFSHIAQGPTGVVG